MGTKLQNNSLQVGDSSTSTQNFVLQSNADGTAKLARGNIGATTQDLIAVDSTGNVQLTKTTSQSMVRLNTANGYGSTNTKIRRFTNVVTNQGTDITYADSATLGASFTINANGVYAFSYTDTVTNTPNYFGVSLNTATPTANIEACAINEILTIASSTTTAQTVLAGATVYLPAGSVIRPHSDGGTATGALQFFTITRVS